MRLGGCKRIRPNSHIVVKSRIVRRSGRSSGGEAPADRGSGEVGQRPGAARCVERNFRSRAFLAMVPITEGRVLINRFGRRSLAMTAIPRFADSNRTSPEVRERPGRDIARSFLVPGRHHLEAVRRGGLCLRQRGFRLRRQRRLHLKRLSYGESHVSARDSRRASPVLSALRHATLALFRFAQGRALSRETAANRVPRFDNLRF